MSQYAAFVLLATVGFILAAVLMFVIVGEAARLRARWKARRKSSVTGRNAP